MQSKKVQILKTEPKSKVDSLSIPKLNPKNVKIINSIGNKNNEVRFWNFVETPDEEVELMLYGEFVSQKSWWNDDGQITASDFKEQLDLYKDRDNITVRINSNGGDVFTASAIYTLLKDCKASITVKIDGMAMSAATVVAMAGDKVLIPSTSIFMIHDPLAGLCGYYNISDLEKVINRLSVVKNTIINAYINKTDKTKEEIEDLMTNELWLTGEDAVNEGFCDEVMFSETDNEPVLDGNNLIINSVSIDLANYNVSDEFKTKIKNKKGIEKNQSGFSNTANIQNDSFLNINKNQRGEDEVIKNAQELKNKYPDVYNEVVNTAKEEERNRIKNIDELGAQGYEDLINKAKYEEMKDAGSCAIAIMKAQKGEGENFLKNREDDVATSNVNKVPVANADGLKEGKYDDKETDDVFNKALVGTR
ncbi:head maturation protease, ClpP-related [Clostridium botulinum]|uniref:head maturation protease, ClpP-related n=1 Tax=Clostridium botulinum TaxID=1491 RepID=UPI001FB02C87|nr:head maturation protease, ClpP-related [Clostridium botulinum]